MATDKQRKAAILTAENIGKPKPLTGKEIMAQAGYGEVIQNSPKQVMNSKGFQEVLEEYLPDKKLFKRHNQLLDKKETILKNNVTTGEIEKIKTGEIDTTAVSKGLDMAYKLKGRYIEHKVVEGRIEHEHKQDPENFIELQAIKLEFENRLRQKLMQTNE